MTEEQAFLRAILERPDDDAPKLIYADWLEERGDPRAEFLRGMVKVRRKRPITRKQRQRHSELSAELAALRTQEWQEWESAIANRLRPEFDRERQRRVRELERQLADLSRKVRRRYPARLRELAATFDPNWLAVVSDPEIEGCGKSGSPLRFDFVCDKSWADLKPTGDDNVRHCEACRKNVHFCDNIADAREHSRAGRCVAVDLGVIRRNGDLTPPMALLGKVTPTAVRRSREENVDPVSQARLDARKQAGTQGPPRR